MWSDQCPSATATPSPTKSAVDGRIGTRRSMRATPRSPRIPLAAVQGIKFPRGSIVSVPGFAAKQCVEVIFPIDSVLSARSKACTQTRRTLKISEMLCTRTQAGFSRISLLSRLAYHTLRRNRPHLDGGAVLQGWKVFGNLGGLVQAPYLKQEEATNSFFGLCKRTV